MASPCTISASILREAVTCTCKAAQSVRTRTHTCKAETQASSYEEEPGEIWAHYLTEKSDRFFEAFGGRLYTAPSSLKQMRSSGNTLKGGGGDRKDSNASQSHVPAEF